ncbi:MULTISPECIES: hypothetical protein [Psychrilyobacter]|uniref:Swt1-like HEPN domain-containing protein n=1 Tax=Psychrilyobacter piezotolerans TaxID=2293438 RepID=A0ABX9KIL7_9FUSO|nr:MULTISPECIES: hypothetical protein [Psychrilyobacter]MCS5420786.1 hypothetical protein [Psychrilyobacter sp. S5]NDI77420.1 hypothetical protein [Psychrilyobacter piezotolerans]RDE63723.1 hypothetical protein DV867_04935 [Psychrilyobacter sp. S5]REI42067.1 hypothetical protein DYH56_04935 [Psychrilyobacter piezotolerans]
MEITFLENGIDSLQKGFKSLNEYEQIREGENKNKFFLLKDTIINIHHGIEILMKHILKDESPYLIYSQIDRNVKSGYQEMRQKKLNSIFKTNLKNKIHTVTYEEAFERLKFICGHDFSEKVETKILKLSEYRNQITHSEIFFKETDIINLFEGFLDEIDHYFFESIGKDYKTLNGYSELVINMEKYQEILEEKNLILKKEILDCLGTAFKKLKFGMGADEVKRITDLNTAMGIVEEILKKDFTLGTDLYNGFCSGRIKKIRRISKDHISIFTEDNGSEYIFKFKSMILYFPDLLSNFSPILIFEADEDESDIEKYKDFYSVDMYGRKELTGLYFLKENRLTFDPKEVNDFYYRLDYDEDFVAPSNYPTYKFLTKTIFCQLNVQGLDYVGFEQIIRKYKDLDGSELEKLLKNSL